MLPFGARTQRIIFFVRSHLLVFKTDFTNPEFVPMNNVLSDLLIIWIEVLLDHVQICISLLGKVINVCWKTKHILATLHDGNIIGITCRTSMFLIHNIFICSQKRNPLKSAPRSQASSCVLIFPLHEVPKCLKLEVVKTAAPWLSGKYSSENAYNRKLEFRVTWLKKKRHTEPRALIW